MKPSKLLAIVGASLLGLTMLRCTSTVPAGHVRVRDTFGYVSSRKLQPGVNFPVNPFSSRIKIDVRTKELKEPIKVPTNEGLMVNLDVSVLYHANPEKADEIYKSIGVDYEQIIVSPILRNVSRDVVADHSSEDLYGPGREKIAAEITNSINPLYAERGIVLESVLLRDVQLPSVVTNAIQMKMAMKQDAERMQYVLTKATQEAEVKRAEAKGIAGSQDIIAGSLSPEYLEWKYIDVINVLAKSHNDTVVIAPYDPRLLPTLPEGKDYSPRKVEVKK